LGYAALSDSSVIVAFWIGAISIILTAAILLQVLWMRLELMQQRIRTKAFLERWRPIMLQVIGGGKPELPVLHTGELMMFLHLWVHFQESLRGDVKDSLNSLLIQLRLESGTRNLLRKGSLDEKLIAATALGHLRSHDAWDELAILLNRKLAVLSITAARALVTIDPIRARDVVIDFIIHRRDWPVEKLASILKESQSVFLDAFFAHIERDVQEHQPYLPRLIRLVEAMQLNYLLPFIRTLLESSDDPQLIAPCLRMIRDPGDLESVRKQLGSHNWQVQVQAARVLGRMGVKEDVPHLVALLGSREWWVRYRCAQALVAMPFLSRQDLERLLDALEDPFASDILKQAMAEKS
jgi:HEAT repeat protein